MLKVHLEGLCRCRRLRKLETDDAGLECQTKYFGLVGKEKAPQAAHCWRFFNNGVTQAELLFSKIDPTDNYVQYELEGRHRSEENQLICVSRRTLDSDRKHNSTWLEQIRVLLDHVTKTSTYVCLYPVLYNKDFGWSMTLTPGRSPLNPWNFLNNRSIFVIHGRPW